MKTIGEQIKKSRIALGLKPCQLAFKSGIGKGLISELESNKRKNITLDTLDRLCKAMKIRMSFLIQQWEKS